MRPTRASGLRARRSRRRSSRGPAHSPADRRAGRACARSAAGRRRGAFSASICFSEDRARTFGSRRCDALRERQVRQRVHARMERERMERALGPSASTWGAPRLRREPPPRDAAASAAARSRRHCSGSASFCRHANVTGRPVSRDSVSIQESSGSSGMRSDATSSTPRPGSPRTRPMPIISSAAANVPGTHSPSMARWRSVRELEKPSAPAATPSRTIAAIAACRRPSRARSARRARP